MTDAANIQAASDAQWLYEHRDEVENNLGESVETTGTKPLDITFSFRVPQDEARYIRESADKAGMKLSEFIRAACHAWNAPPQQHTYESELDEVKARLDQIERKLAS